MRPLKIASRGSKLAMVQSNQIRELLVSICGQIDISIEKISTKGDRDRSDFLYKSDSIGFFTSEVENALLEQKADIAVHSLKDLPTACTKGLRVAAVPRRESAADVLVALHGISSISALASGAAVGTSSLRRIAQLRRLRSDLKCVPLRGNVETRVSKVVAGEIDAAVMAFAGLNRLGLSERISAVLSADEFLPAPAQGALAVQIRDDDEELAELVSKIDDKSTRIAVEAERRILSSMHGGCSIPLGVHSEIAGDRITIDAVICSVEGDKYIKRSVTGQVAQAGDYADKLAEELLDAGGRAILRQIRDSRSA